MKRSEMIASLEYYLCTYEEPDGNTLFAFPSAEELLAEVERLGMLPPKCGQYEAVELTPTGNKNCFTKFIYGWEKE